MYRSLLDKGVTEGVINLHFTGGERYRFGHGGREATWVVEDEAIIKRIARNWEFQLGQTYMEGGWQVTDCELQDLLYILRANFATYRVPRLLKPLALLLQQWNRLSISLSNVSSHYDLDTELFKLFLDRDMHYSCAYFTQPDIDLKARTRPNASISAINSCCIPAAKYWILDVAGEAWPSTSRSTKM